MENIRYNNINWKDNFWRRKIAYLVQNWDCPVNNWLGWVFPTFVLFLIMSHFSFLSLKHAENSSLFPASLSPAASHPSYEHSSVNSGNYWARDDALPIWINVFIIWPRGWDTRGKLSIILFYLSTFFVGLSSLNRYGQIILIFLNRTAPWIVNRVDSNLWGTKRKSLQ